jgi:hypothetical protein
MANNWIVKFNNKGMTFSSDYARATFLDFRKQNTGMSFKLVPHATPSDEQRGYYFAAVIPAFAEYSDNYDENNPEHLLQIAELFKIEFNPSFLTNLAGESMKIGKSTTTLNKRAYGEFLERIERYYEQNGIPWPDTSLYKKWEDMYQDAYPKYRDWLKAMNIKCNGDVITVD